ncbi:MAG: hypothetical protein WC889_07380 [Myxococcota bacterium]|jgi:hypothetical protein
MIKRSGQDGLTFVAVIVYLAILSGGYLAYLYLPVLIDYYKVQEVLAQTANKAYTIHENEPLIHDCDDQIARSGIVAEKAACKFIRNTQANTATASYTFRVQVKFIPSDYVRLYEREISVSQDLSYKMRR